MSDLCKQREPWANTGMTGKCCSWLLITRGSQNSLAVSSTKSKGARFEQFKLFPAPDPKGLACPSPSLPGSNDNKPVSTELGKPLLI